MRLDSIEQRVDRLLREYCDAAPDGTIDGRMSLRDDLVIESMSLLSLTVRLGEELGVDVTEMDLQLDSLRSVADLIRMARVLSKSRPISKLGN